MSVNYEQLLERSNRVEGFVRKSTAELGDQVYLKESPDKWSFIEVVEHLNLVYDVYLENFEKVLTGLRDLEEGEEAKLQSSLMGRLSIWSQRPKNRKRRFKMKTFKFFEPKVDQKEVLVKFYDNKERFSDVIKEARVKDVRGIKVPTALGQRVKFYVPECIDFVISHEERHVVQMEKIMNQLDVPVS